MCTCCFAWRSVLFFLSSVTDPSVVNNQGGLTNCCILHFEYENDTFRYIDSIRPDFESCK